MSSTMRQIKFQKMAAEFNEASRDRRPCSSSSSSSNSTGASSSERYWRSTAESCSLSDLVNSFMESEGDAIDENEDLGEEEEEELEDNSPVVVDQSFDESEREELLKRLLVSGSEDENLDQLKGEIVEIVKADEAVRENRSGREDISLRCRRLIARLRGRGYDAGLCKSMWEKTSRHPAGTHEYIDVLTPSNDVSKPTRYIVELFLASQFEIARPTAHYTALLATFPAIFIGRVEELKRIVKIMGTAMKESLKSQGLQVAPWRSRVYMLAKWSGSYKRSTMKTTKFKGAGAVMVDGDKVGSERRWSAVVGFCEKACSMRLQAVVSKGISSASDNCRNDFAGKGKAAATQMRVGLLSVAFQGK